MKSFFYAAAIFLLLATSAFATVYVSTPTNNAVVSSPVEYKATATSSTCSKGVASMGIYVDNNLVYVVDGASLDHELSLSDGSYHTVVEEWDRCGGATYTPIDITVKGGSGGHSLQHLQASGGWKSWGELPPGYGICNYPCPGVSWWMKQGIKSPSLSGDATEFYIGGSKPYADVLFSNPLIGQGSTQGLPDTSHTLLPTLHNFTYDVYFYPTNIGVTQVLEFDISMYFDSLGLIWGNQCNILGGHVWDVWDNVSHSWVSTGVPCNPVNNAWNHLTIQVQRESDNWLLFQSITLNGQVHNINRYYAPGKAPSNWWGITVNYQMDGNYHESAYTTYLDNFTFTYW